MDAKLPDGTSQFPNREVLADVADVGWRTIAALENAERPIGIRSLRRIGAALPGWTADTPERILAGEAAPADSLSDEPRDEDVIQHVLTMSREELVAMAAVYDRIDRGLGDRWLEASLRLRRELAPTQHPVVDPT